jgi:hypothetical protein
LVAEGVAHHEGRVSSGATQVNETTFSQKDDASAVGKSVTINLRLDVIPLTVLLDPGNVDFAVEVTDIANDGVILHLLNMFGTDDSGAAGGSDEHVCLAAGLLHGGNFVTFHGGLESVDGINFRDDNTGSEGAERLGGSLTDVTVSSNDGNLTGNHDVSSALDSVEKGLTASVQVIELGLGNTVVDVDGREFELALGQTLVKVVDTSGGFLAET